MKIPKLVGEYVHVYRPEPDIFQGPDSRSFLAGKQYREWVPNDFTIVRHEGKWHLIGITHPCPAWYHGLSSDCRGLDIHEAEWQLFHAVSVGETLKDSLYPGGFMQTAQVLPATCRPGESPNIWAPICWKKDDLFYMLYAPDPIRLATSYDLNAWETQGPVFFCNEPSARDPNIMEQDGVYTVVYLAGNTLYIRTSTDLRNFSESRLLFQGPDNMALESPILKYVDGMYYLFYSVYDGLDRVNGSYDNRTYVHAASSLEAMAEAPCVAFIQAHAPELIQGEDGQWYIASVEWPNRGVSIAPLAWCEADE